MVAYLCMFFLHMAKHCGFIYITLLQTWRKHSLVSFPILMVMVNFDCSHYINFFKHLQDQHQLNPPPTPPQTLFVVGYTVFTLSIRDTLVLFCSDGYSSISADTLISIRYTYVRKSRVRVIALCKIS